jgi:hypothetical protein
MLKLIYDITAMVILQEPLTDLSKMVLLSVGLQMGSCFFAIGAIGGLVLASRELLRGSGALCPGCRGWSNIVCYLRTLSGV